MLIRRLGRTDLPALLNLYPHLHADFRRRGLGAAVIQAALAHAWSHDCYKVMLMTGRKGEATRLFYQSVGFDADAKKAFVATPD